METPEQQAARQWAHEIETDLVLMVWRQPERIADLLRQFDPRTHLGQLHLRYLLEAIELSFSELSAVDFATVAETLRELGKLEECGGTQGLAELWRQSDYSVAALVGEGQVRERQDKIFNYCLETLRTYAARREAGGHYTLARFSGGSGRLEPNRLRRSEREPGFKGLVRIAGKLYRAAGYVQSDGAIDVRYVPV